MSIIMSSTVTNYFKSKNEAMETIPIL